MLSSDEIIGGQMKRVFFLGAGATKADFPSAPLNDLLLKGLLESRFGKTKDVEDFLKKFFNLCNSGSLPRIEDVLSFLDSSLHQRFSCKGYGYEEFLKVRMSLVYLMGQLFKDKLEGDAKGVARKLCDKLTEEDVIISTNYDIIIDNALWWKGEGEQNVNYGGKVRYSGSLPESHNEETASNFKKSSKTQYPNQGKIELLKIHGSLNFLYCPKCKKVDVTVGEKGIVHCMHSKLGVPCTTNCTEKYIDLIITPTYFKEYNNPFLRRIWCRAENAISAVDEIIFIGYSMPDADTEIKCMLLRGIARNTNRPKITVVDKIETSEKLGKLPENVQHNDLSKYRISYKASEQLLVLKGVMKKEEKDGLLKLSAETSYQEVIERLFRSSQDESKGVEDRYQKLFGKITFHDCGFEKYLDQCNGERT